MNRELSELDWTKMKKLDHIEVIKDIPGYKMILKAVLKTQIQQLVKPNNNPSLPKFTGET